MEKVQPDSPSTNSTSSNCSSKNNESTKPSYGRYCHIVKRTDFDGYGFNLHSEKIKPGQYIGKVDPNSPAEAGGLHEGDQIIEVNGVNIGVETHKQVVQRIKAISNEVRLLLIDPNTESNTKSHTNIAEKNTIKNSTSTNIKSDNAIPTAQPNSTMSIVPMLVEANTTPENLKDNVTSITTVCALSQSELSNSPRVDVTDYDASEIVNGNHAILNGNLSEHLTETTNLMNSNKSQPQNTDTSQNNVSTNKTGLNLNLTAAEMRAKLLAKKKIDPKNESVDLKKKFDIIQKL